MWVEEKEAQFPHSNVDRVQMHDPHSNVDRDDKEEPEKKDVSKNEETKTPKIDSSNVDETLINQTEESQSIVEFVSISKETKKVQIKPLWKLAEKAVAKASPKMKPSLESYKTKTKMKPSLESNEDRNCVNCTYCRKVFKSHEYLKVHEKWHRGELEYPCNVCGRAFEHSSDLKKHITIHSRELPYKCQLCGKDFGRGQLLKEHMRAQHSWKLLKKEYKEELNGLEKMFENLQKKIDVAQAEKSRKSNEDSLNISKEVENLQKRNKKEKKESETKIVEYQAKISTLETETSIRKNDKIELETELNRAHGNLKSEQKKPEHLTGANKTLVFQVKVLKNKLGGDTDDTLDIEIHNKLSNSLEEPANERKLVAEFKDKVQSVEEEKSQATSKIESLNKEITRLEENEKHKLELSTLQEDLREKYRVAVEPNVSSLIMEFEGGGVSELQRGSSKDLKMQHILQDSKEGIGVTEGTSHVRPCLSNDTGGAFDSLNTKDSKEGASCVRPSLSYDPGGTVPSTHTAFGLHYGQFDPSSTKEGSRRL